VVDSDPDLWDNGAIELREGMYMYMAEHLESVEKLMKALESAQSKISVMSEALEYYRDQDNVGHTDSTVADDKFESDCPTFYAIHTGYFPEHGSVFVEDGSVARIALEETGY
jgi:hypothetical protein